MLCQTSFSVQTGIIFSSKKLKFPTVLLLFLICAVKNVNCQGAGEFPPQRFSIEPVEGTPVEEGTTKYLICRTTSVPIPNYRWLKDGVNISDYSTSYSYRIQNIARSDAGAYRCEASNELGSILSSEAVLHVAYMDEFENKGQTIYVRTNQSEAAVIPLPHIDSVPFPTITWFENTLPMNDEAQKHQVTLNKTLVLLDRDTAQSRSYQPEALNGKTGSGSIQMGPTINVTVTGVSGLSSLIAPVIVIPPVDKVVSNKKDPSAKFECVVNARPVSGITILWYRADEVSQVRTLLSPGSKYIIAYTNRTLTIRSPDTSDNGVYECEARVIGLPDIVTAQASLTVYMSPTFSENEDLTKVFDQDLGDSVSIPCQARGTPTPTIHWLMNGKELNINSDPSYTINSNGTLSVSQLNEQHSGVYQCFIRNEVGEASKSAWVKVNSAPTFITRPTDITVIEGDDAQFDCQTQGAPRPVVTWYKDSGNGFIELVPGRRVMVINGGDLLIRTTQSSDSGQYRCNSSNSQGTIIADATLRVFEKQEYGKVEESDIEMLTMKIEKNDDTFEELSEGLLRIQRGFMEEKKSRKGDINAMYTILTDVLQNQTGMTENHENMVRVLSDLDNVTHALMIKSDLLEQKLDALRKEINSLEKTKVQVKSDNKTLGLTPESSTSNAVKEISTETSVRRETVISKQAQEWSVRLVGGREPHEGRVEVSYGGRHGTVCHNGWGDDDARVVCKMLGYSPTRAKAYYGPTKVYGHTFGEGTGEILLSYVACQGDEDSLFLCKHAGIGGHNCNHGQDAGVWCRISA